MRKMRDRLEKRKTKFQRPGGGGDSWGELPGVGGREILTHSSWGTLGLPRAPTVDEGPIQPLDVVVLGEGEQHLVADDGEGQQKDSAQRHGQGEGAQPQPAGGTRVSSGSGPPQVSQPGWRPPRGTGPRRLGGPSVLARQGEEAAERPTDRERDGQELTQSC